ncbi:MAG: family 10 glycosylhydrolase [Armatimonadota bacterium]|nr:family 10 glycosylhydrolase [Armatimonadota bacterium]MDR7463787.1 family 10 glycosylhydrolase [Armatimonadota bacterium]MDR7469467.1 family 10 glycosylhydrolase [Armatimonadota bacterium]MDR7473827.1 family 10 glycosylhydrolase [Armatimonadota bacterium]MDR7539114.1 family 10 glycosylhydrolase [Armatimonadota bacterium]
MPGYGAALRVLLAAAVLLAWPAGPAWHAAAAAVDPAPTAAPDRPSWLPRRALWIEVSANLPLLSSRAAIRGLVARVRAAGIDTLIPEAKNAWGFVTYESGFAPHIRTSPVARSFSPSYPPPREWYPEAFDPLATVIEEAHAAGLQVHVAVNVFGAGLDREGVGLAFERPAWREVHATGTPGEAGVTLASGAGTPGAIVFTNPAHPEVQLYELAVLWEIVSRYPIDGIVLDRARYSALSADFSELTRARFEAALDRPLVRWPDEVLRPSGESLRRGPLFGAWVAWRARVIREFVRAAGQLVRRIRPGIPLAMYVGAWYPTAYEVGQNWGRPDAPPLFSAWTPAWGEASLLPHLDYLIAGLYYPSLSPREALFQRRPPWRSVAGGAALAREVTRGTPVLGGIWLQLYAADRARGRRAIRTAARQTDGVMVFDLSDVIQGDWWEAIAHP